MVQFHFFQHKTRVSCHGEDTPMDQEEDGERREQEERLNRFLWPPPSQGTQKHSPVPRLRRTPWLPLDVTSEQDLRMHQAPLFALPAPSSAPLPTGRKPEGTGQRELPCAATCPDNTEISTVKHVMKKKNQPPCRRSLWFLFLPTS